MVLISSTERDLPPPFSLLPIIPSCYVPSFLPPPSFPMLSPPPCSPPPSHSSFTSLSTFYPSFLPPSSAPLLLLSLCSCLLPPSFSPPTTEVPVATSPILCRHQLLKYKSHNPYNRCRVFRGGGAGKRSAFLELRSTRNLGIDLTVL